MLKQGQFQPLKMEEQVCSIYCGVNGYLDKLPLNRVKPFEDGLLSTLRTKNPEILDAIRSSKDLSDAVGAQLKGVVDAYAKSFT